MSISSELAENKLLLLYLIYKMDVPLKNSYISQFALEGGYMDYFSLQQYLNELEVSEYLEKSRDNNSTLYTLTGKGEEVLGFFLKHISDKMKSEVNKYISKNKKKVERDFEIAANYFYCSDNEYIVKCGVYENEAPQMEISLTVVTKEEAKLICANWRNNSPKIFGAIRHILLYGNNEKEPFDENMENIEAIN